MIYRELGRTSAAVRRAVQRFRTQVLKLVVRDRVGLVIFLSSLITYVLCWRIGVFITDTYAIANAFVAVADGHLWVGRAVYGSDAVTPGMHAVNGNYYARNYGQIVTALPFLWLTRSVTTFVPLSIAVSAVWSLLLFVLADQLGVLFDKRRTARHGAGLVGLLLFASNVTLAKPIDGVLLPLVALELQTMVSGALTATVLYRLLTHVHGKRVGAFAGLVTGLATPIGFWALSPKRHALGGLVIVTVLYLFYRSRSQWPASAGLSSLRLRAVAYVLVGLWAWVHAAEALVLLIALVLVDVPTAPTNDRQTLGTIAIAFILSLIPFLVTNTLISGNPFVPPRLLDSMTGSLPSAEGASIDPSPDSAGGSESASNGQTPSESNLDHHDGTRTESKTDTSNVGGSRPGEWGFVVVWKIFLELLAPLEKLLNQLSTGATILFTQPNRVVATFLKSGTSPKVGSELARSTNLTVLESTPIVGGFIGAALVRFGSIVGRMRRPLGVVSRPNVVRGQSDGRRATDLLVGFIVIGYVLMYLPSLPIHAQITVRYLVPVVPLFVYAVVRTEPVRECLENAHSTVYWSWALGVGIGLQFVADAIVLFDLTRAEAMQIHAWLSLGTVFLIVVIMGSKPRHRSTEIVAVSLGLAAAAGSIFLLLSGLDYFSYVGTYALPIVRRAVGSITLV